MRNRTGQRNRAIEPFADFLHQRKGRSRSGMATRTGSDRDQAIGPLLDSLARKTIIDDVMERYAAPCMYRLVQVLTCPQRRDRDRHLPLGANCDIFIEAVVRTMDDLVHRIGSRRTIRIVTVVRCQLFGNLVKPFVELARGACIERREAADNPRLALRDNQFRTGYNEQR